MDGMDSVLDGVANLLDAYEMSEVTEGDFDQLAARLYLAERLSKRMSEVLSALRLQLADLMPGNAQELPVMGIGMIRRTRSKRSTWRDQQASKAMRDDIAVAVARAVSVDQFTGDISDERRNAAYAAVKNVWDIIPAPSDMKQGASSYGLDKDDYRATTWVDGVEILPLPEGWSNE